MTVFIDLLKQFKTVFFTGSVEIRQISFYLSILAYLAYSHMMANIPCYTLSKIFATKSRHCFGYPKMSAQRIIVVSVQQFALQCCLIWDINDSSKA